MAYGFCNVWPSSCSRTAGPERLALLLRGFFARAEQVAAGELVASVRMGTFLSPCSVAHWPQRLFCIEDPIDPSRNLGDRVTPETIQDLRNEIRRARSLREANFDFVALQARSPRTIRRAQFAARNF